MNKRKVQEIYLKNDAYLQTLYEWTQLVERYKKDAPMELWRCISHTQPPEGLEVHFGTSFNLATMDTMFLFVVKETLVEGFDMKPYPVYDKSRWPWVVAVTEPVRLPKDVWGLILRQLSIETALELARVNRYIRDCVLRDENWLWRLQFFCRLYFNFTDFIPVKWSQGATWKKLAYFQWLSTKDSKYREKLRFGIYLRLPRHEFDRIPPLECNVKKIPGIANDYITFRANDVCYFARRIYRTRTFIITSERGIRVGNPLLPMDLEKYVNRIPKWTCERLEKCRKK